VWRFEPFHEEELSAEELAWISSICLALNHRSSVIDYVICAAKSEKKLLGEPCVDSTRLPDFSSPPARAAEGIYHWIARDARDSKWTTVAEAYASCTNVCMKAIVLA
jgi:hypothetical protein